MSEEMTWRPIETAPKDGSDVQVWHDDGWGPQAHWCEKKQGWYTTYWDADWRSYSESGVYGASHWMPLPAPPALATASKEGGE